MDRLLAPGIALLNQLRYPQKFALISAMLIVPLALAIGLLYIHTEPQLISTRSELAGTRYIRSLGSLLNMVEASHHAIHEDKHQELAELSATIASAVADLPHTPDAVLLTSDGAELQPIKAGQHELAAAIVQGDSGRIDEAHLSLMAAIRDEIRRAGDRSSLILDPELTTYYLMDLVVVQTPERIVLLSEARHTIEELRAGRTADAEGRQRAFTLSALAGQLSSNGESTRKGVEATIASEPGIGEQLAPELADALTKSALLVEQFHDISAGDQSLDEVEGVLDSAGEGLHASMRLWRVGLSLLEVRLQARIDRLVLMNRVAQLSGLLLSILAIYLLLAFYRSVMRAVNTLDHASKQLRGEGAAVHLATRDELGQVVASFNRVAAALAEENRQRQIAEAERAQLQQEIISAQHATLDELSAPIIPIGEATVLLPLIGTIDSRRAQQILATLLRGVSEHRATTVVIDMSGVRVIDTQVARTLVDAAAGVQLLGARVALAGLRSDVAQTIVRLGLDFDGFTFYATLQDAIADARALR